MKTQEHKNTRTLKNETIKTDFCGRVFMFLCSSDRRLVIIALVLVIFGGVGLWSVQVLADHNGGDIDTNLTGEHWAWNPVIGWINFDHSDTNGRVEITATELLGWAESDVGPIVFNCKTTPPNRTDTCATVSYGVVNNNGLLSGWAWNDVLGWISFDCDDLGICGASSYQARITPENASNSYFNGYAWSEVAGWIAFDCKENDPDGGPGGFADCIVGGVDLTDWRVQTNAGAAGSAITGTLVSNIYDTGVSDPYYNYVLFQGTSLSGTSVNVELATSDVIAGPWNFSPIGQLNPGIKRTIDNVSLQNKRYYKYKIIMTSDNWITFTPVINDFVVNWSP